MKTIFPEAFNAVRAMNETSQLACNMLHRVFDSTCVLYIWTEILSTIIQVSISTACFEA